MGDYLKIERFVDAKELEHLCKIVEGAVDFSPLKTQKGDVEIWTVEPHQLEDEVFDRVVARARARYELTGDESLIGGDTIFLKYGFGGYMNPHFDKTGEGQHVRLGILLRDPYVGGILYVNEEPVQMRAGDAVIYRADLVEHRVSRVKEGQRFLLTIGQVY
jgi:hypothetical protein